MEARGKRPKTGRRRLAVMALGIVFILLGAGVFLFSSAINDRVRTYIQPNEDPADPMAFQQTWYTSYAVFGFALALIGVGTGLVRSAFHTSVQGFMSGGSAMGMGPSEEFLKSLSTGGALHSQLSSADAERVAASEKTVVKVKCRNCGNLESEDGAFCRKCGQAL